MNSAKYRKSSQADMVPRRRRQMWAASETDGSEEMDVTDGERGGKCSLSSGGYAACADNLAQEGLRSFFFPLWMNGGCNSKQGNVIPRGKH